MLCFDSCKGCIDDEMCRGIDSSAVFVVCITKKYMLKVRNLHVWKLLISFYFNKTSFVRNEPWTEAE